MKNRVEASSVTPMSLQAHVGAFFAKELQEVTGYGLEI
jgi:hypothetical protein